MRRSAVWKLWSFVRESKGNVALLFGLSLIPIALAVGFATDYGRATAVRSRMIDAADAAALAVGSWPDLNQADMKRKAQQFFDANYSSAQLGTAGKINVSFIDDDIKVDVSGTVPTSFMRLVNIPSINVGASSVVTRRQRNIELALVLDTTGSMDSSGKMDAMQSAAKKMVQDLFGGNDTSDSLKVAVVPFAAAVNVGEDKKKEDWIDRKAKSDVSYEDFDSRTRVFKLLRDMKGSPKWSGCVRERDGDDYELTDATPSSSDPDSQFAPYFAPDEPDHDHDDGDSYANDYIDDGNCGENNSHKRDADTCQRYTGKYEDASINGSSKGPDYNCPPRAITELTNKQGPVVSAIEQLQPKGNTVIPAGLLWGWRVLSPTEPYTEGRPYGDEEWIKAIVLLTDGENSISSWSTSGNHNKSAYSAFGYASEGHMGSSGNNPESSLNSKTETVCNNIKAKGILIYTIGFRVNDYTTQSLLRNCATKPDMYYNSPSNAELAGVFGDIAQGLSELRIAQ
jgi:Flp pilus assembly protein TadG